MKTCHRTRAIGALLLAMMIALCGLSRAEGVRTWTDTQGRRIQATFVSLNDAGAVTLKDEKTGRMREITVTSLSSADRAYIAGLTQRGARGAFVFDKAEGSIKRMVNRFQSMTKLETKRFGIMSAVVALVNIPIFYFLWVPLFFKTFSNYREAIMFKLQPQIVSAMRGELGRDVHAELKLGFLHIWVFLTVAAQIALAFGIFFM